MTFEFDLETTRTSSYLPRFVRRRSEYPFDEISSETIIIGHNVISVPFTCEPYTIAIDLDSSDGSVEIGKSVILSNWSAKKTISSEPCEKGYITLNQLVQYINQMNNIE